MRLTGVSKHKRAPPIAISKCGYEIMVIVDTPGSLKTAKPCDAVALRHSQLLEGNLNFFIKVPKNRGVIGCTDGFCDRTTYAIWHNKLYSAGWAGAVAEEDRRLSTILELEQGDQYFRVRVFGTFSKERCSVWSRRNLDCADRK